MNEVDASSSAATISGDKRELFVAYLAGRDVPCPRCGYNLRNLASVNCPECGEELTLGVGLVEPKQAAAITGLIGLSAGAGLNGLLLICWIVISLRIKQGFTWFVPFNASGFIVTGVLLLFWLRGWKRIRRLPSRSRWALAIATWAISLMDAVTFALCFGP